MVVVLVHSKREEFTWQKETLFQPKLQGGRMSVKFQEKRKIRKNSKISKRRVLATSSTLSISQATSSSSSQPSFRSMRKQCLKCQGWIVSQSIDLSEKIETRCLNCGWQPRYGARIIKEPEEARAIRRFTGGFLSGTGENVPLSSLEQAFFGMGKTFAKRQK